MTSPETSEDPKTRRIEHAWLVVRRLERISADSIWAHRSSGYRGALIRALEQYERAAGEALPERDRLDFVLRWSYQLLENAARELGDPEA